MTPDEIAQYLEGMTDDEIVSAVSEAYADTANAASQAPNSEWHQACFAGLMTYAQEALKRGMHIPCAPTLH